MDVRSWPAVFLRFVLALFIAVVASAATVAEVATAATFTYDATTVARVDVRQFVAIEAGQAQLSDVREASASPPAELSGAVTTPLTRVVAINTRMSGATTVGGTDLATSNMRTFSTRNPEPGYYDVVGHGSPNDVAGLSPGQLADRIRTSSGGQNVRLLSRQTGCPSGTFAQDLADDLGVRVMAPTTDIGASNTGKTLTIFDGGEWRWFNPGN